MGPYYPNSIVHMYRNGALEFPGSQYTCNHRITELIEQLKYGKLRKSKLCLNLWWFGISVQESLNKIFQGMRAFTVECSPVGEKPTGSESIDTEVQE
ncbi:hypothetical protein H6P81_004579 [Aristolochia fimbriata]|uniref:Uncharacterized protein n=1 Tax=Aristolochia fimbriata TaxID=158543 RepID=A0AAV7EUC2_ARIFI|nr:hypothetical protein H6P81_004579 [Aristolochia fimbriata]